MREILFRGKCPVDERWHEGYYIETIVGDKIVHCIIPLRKLIEYDKWICQVDSATVGQYSGLQDKNGERIFDGDIILITDEDGDTEFTGGGVATVCFDQGMYYAKGEMVNWLNTVSSIWCVEVIGNIYDNPDLLVS